MPTTARQLPWVGSALNWHGQPYAQLQFANSRPCSVQDSMAVLQKAANPYRRSGTDANTDALRNIICSACIRIVHGARLPPLEEHPHDRTDKAARTGLHA